MTNVKLLLSIIFSTFILCSCSESSPPSTDRYLAVDTLFDKIDANVRGHQGFDKIQEIDHSRLGVKEGSVMPPARVIIFSDAKLDTAIINKHPQAGLELPLRILAYQDLESGEAKIIYNSFDYIRSRFELGKLPEMNSQYNEALGDAITGINPEQIKHFSNDNMRPNGIITITSPYNFQTTKTKVLNAISAQDDTVSFGEIDFQARALAIGSKISANTLILFGGPAPGAKAMSKAPTLGLDAFCQKFLLWEDNLGQTHLSFNDLLIIAERQGVNKSVALRVINYRLTSVFEEALE